jgi:hypothetical protein
MPGYRKMAKEKTSGTAAGIPATHPALAKLASDGIDVAEVVGLRGIVGTPPADGVFRLHPRLDDLTISVDIGAGDVVHVAAASELPNDVVVAWVRRDTEVTFRRTRIVFTSAETVAGFLGGLPDADVGSASGEMRSGRLNIRLNPRALPQEFMASGVCTSRCNTCMSRCRGGGQHNHEVVM